MRTPIDLDSLAANTRGTELFWLHSGQPREAPFG
jgi:hypothetical protein